MGLQEVKEVTVVQNPQYTKKRTRKAGSRSSLNMGDPVKTTPIQPITPASTRRRGTRGGRSKGWRQTPLLEDTNKTNLQPSQSRMKLKSPIEPLKKKQPHHSKLTPEYSQGRRRRYREEEDQNGWATGEVTDIQDMGDFDFEENLSKFDKRKVFDQIRQDDTTADEARLVSFNRLAPRAGTSGGKNLHFTENVLEPLNGVKHSSGDSELDFEDVRISSGRSSRRNLSRTSTSLRKAPSRKGSALAAADQHRPGSTLVPEIVELARHTARDQTGSPMAKTDSSTSRYRKAIPSLSKPSLRLAASKHSCPCVSPLQMLELEQLAMSELDMTEDMMTENAARSIAETACKLITRKMDDLDDLSRRSTPLIVILAGNNKTGSRAIAAGRHLRNHGTHIVLCVLGLEREHDLLDSVRRQLKIFRNCGGQAIKQDRLLRTLRKLPVSTALIVDALLGMHVCFDDLRTDDQAAYFQLVCWANATKAGTLAIDIPSGIDASTGKDSPFVLTSKLPTPPNPPFSFPILTYKEKHCHKRDQLIKNPQAKPQPTSTPTSSSTPTTFSPSALQRQASSLP